MTSPPFGLRLPLNLSSQAFIDHKHALYPWLLQHAPVCPMRFSVLQGHFICRYEDCERMLRDPLFRRQRIGETGEEWWMRMLPRSWALAYSTMLNQDDPDHRRLRGFITKAFTPRAVSRLEPRIAALTQELLDDLEARSGRGEAIDLVADYAMPLPAAVIGELLGVRPANMGAFVGLINALVQSFRGWGLVRNLTWDLPRVVRFVDQVIADKRASPGEDLLSELIRVEQEGERMTTDELAATVLALIIGGFETTVHLISSAVVTLCEHPETLAAVREDPALLPRAIEETLRFASPVYSTERMYLAEELVLRGVTLRAGDMVVACLGAANRDPAAFDAPEVFDIHRSPNRHLGFGKGPHYCVGAALARLEGRLALAGLLERFARIELAVPVEDLAFAGVVSIHAYQTVPLRLAVR
jgi:cytochrome P450